MAPKKKQTSSANLIINQTFLTTFICYNWTIRSQQNKFKTLNKQPILQYQQLTNCQMNKILRNNKTNKHLLKRGKDKSLRSNGIKDKSLIRGLINLNKSNLISDRIQNQEECRIRPSPIRKQTKSVDTVQIWTQGKPMLQIKGKYIKYQKEKFKIYLKSISHQMEDSIKNKKFNFLRSSKDYTHIKII